MDALLEAARQEIDPDVRYELYTQVSELCKEDCPIIPVMQSTNTLTAWKDIQGVYGASCVCIPVPGLLLAYRITEIARNTHP